MGKNAEENAGGWLPEIARWFKKIKSEKGELLAIPVIVSGLIAVAFYLTKCAGAAPFFSDLFLGFGVNLASGCFQRKTVTKEELREVLVEEIGKMLGSDSALKESGLTRDELEGLLKEINETAAKSQGKLFEEIKIFKGEFSNEFGELEILIADQYEELKTGFDELKSMLEQALGKLDKIDETTAETSRKVDQVSDQIKELQFWYIKAKEGSPKDMRDSHEETANYKRSIEADRQTRQDWPRAFIYPPVTQLAPYFQNRISELERLRGFLSDENLRAVFICGPGGVGKTQLVMKYVAELEAARAESPDNPPCDIDGIACMRLIDHEHRSPERIIDYICRTLDTEDAEALRACLCAEGEPLSVRLAYAFMGVLSRCRCIAVLDNFEAVLDENNCIADQYSELREFIEACLRHEHKLLLVATSRRALSMSPEVEVGSIGRKAEISLDKGLPTHDAMAMLRERDASGNLGFRDAPDELLSQIVRRCQCIPHTLVALISYLSKPTHTLEMLLADEAKFNDLVEEPARELYASLSSENERLVVHSLAVYQQFENAVPRAAVKHMLSALPVAEILDRLVLNHVIAFDGKRFSLHPLDQQYAYKQLPDTDEAFSRKNLHKIASEFYKQLRLPSSKWKSIEDLDPQLKQIRHLISAGKHDDACRILNEIDREYLALWGYSGLIIELRLQLLDNLEDLELTALNLGNLGVAYYESRRGEMAIDYYNMALAIFREIGNLEQEGRFTGNRALPRADLDDVDGALQDFELALKIARDLPDPMHQCRWLGNLADLRYRKKLIDAFEAVEEYSEAIDIGIEINDRRFVMIWSMNMGHIFLYDLNRLKDAEECYMQAIDYARQTGALRSECASLLELAYVYFKMEKLEERQKCIDEACEKTESVKHVERKIALLYRLGEEYGRSGEHQKQIEYLKQALEGSRHLPEPKVQIAILNALTLLYIVFDRKNDAEESLRALIDLYRKTEDRSSETRTLIQLGDIHLSNQDMEKANECYRSALDIADEMQNKEARGVILLSIARLLHQTGDKESAKLYFEIPFAEIALSEAEELDDAAGQWVLLNRLGSVYYALRDLKNSIKCYEKALPFAAKLGNPDTEAVSIFNLGDAYHAAGEIESAVRYYRQSLALDQPSTNYKCNSALGVASLQAGDPDIAREYFDRCLGLCAGEPEKSKTLYPRGATLALSLLANHRTDEGLDTYRRGLDLPNSKEQIKYAIIDLEVLESVNPDLPGIQEALKLLREAYEKEPEPESESGGGSSIM